MQKLQIIGRLGKNPEMRKAGEMDIATFSVAVSEKYKGEETTEWFNITAFGKLASICGQYLKKGSQVYVDGKLKTDSWDDKSTGEKKYRTGVICNSMEMLGGRSDVANNAPTVSTPVDQGFSAPPAPDLGELPF